MNEKNGAIRDASVLGVPKMLILGLQHMFAMFGATILVPILVNSYFGEDVLHVQVTLICAGVGTLFFHLCSKFKVPAFLGSSFAFLGGFATIANLDTGVFADMSNADKLRMWRYRRSRFTLSNTCSYHPSCRCKKSYAFPSTCCNRSDHYLYRFKSFRLCHKQRFHKLASCIYCTGYHYCI